MATGRRCIVLADLVLVGHTLFALFALFAVLGALLLLHGRIWALVHLPVVLWSSLVNLAHWTCPLTPLEQALRRRGGQASFDQGWVQHYLDPLVRPLGMPRRLELVAGYSVLAWNILLYSLFW